MDVLRKILSIITIILPLLTTWFIFAGKFDLWILGAGIAVVLAVIYLVPINIFEGYYPRMYLRFLYAILFLIYMFYEIFKASFNLAFFALNPRVSLRSSILSYEYQLNSEIGVLFLSTFITLTPGTLVVDLNRDKKNLYIHNLSHISHDKDRTWETIKFMERSLRRITEWLMWL